MRISDWSSDVCSSGLLGVRRVAVPDAADRDAALVRAFGRAAGRRVVRADRRRDPVHHHRRADDRVRHGLYGDRKEHTSELQSLMRISYAVFCLKKKNKTKNEGSQVQEM